MRNHFTTEMLNFEREKLALQEEKDRMNKLGPAVNDVIMLNVLRL